MIEMELTGVNELFAKLDAVAGNRALRPPMERALLALQADMARYPRQRTGTKYRRTGTLGRRWTKAVRADSSGLEGKVGNNTAYGPYVQDAKRQAHVHQGLWQTDAEVMRRRQAEIVADFDQVIQRALGR